MSGKNAKQGMDVESTNPFLSYPILSYPILILLEKHSHIPLSKRIIDYQTKEVTSFSANAFSTQILLLIAIKQ
jgi:hypothetical protein